MTTMAWEDLVRGGPGTYGGEDLLTAVPGRVTELAGPPGSGLTRLGLGMLARVTGTVAYVDVRGWMCPPAAWEVGIAPERLVVVRCDDPVTWLRLVSGLLDGMAAVYAEVPRQVKEARLRTLAAMVRNRSVPLLLRPVAGSLPSGVAHLRLEAGGVTWEGTGAGHGSLGERRIRVEASGKATRGLARIIEVEEGVDGWREAGADVVPVVPGLGAAHAGQAAG